MAASVSRGSSSARPLTRASSRKAAAASAEPPPMPAATGIFFSSRKCPAVRPSMRWRSAATALSTRLSAVGPLGPANGPAMSSAVVTPGCKVSVSAKSANATRLSKLVIAVGAAAEHAQCQIDLGGSLFDQRCGHERAYEIFRKRPFRSAAVFTALFAGLGLRRGLVGQPVFELFLDLRQVFRIGLEIARMRPLELGLRARARCANRRRRDGR